MEGAGPRATSDVPLVAVEAELHFHSRLELPTPGLISRRVNSIGEGLTQWQSELGYPVADVKQSVVSLVEAVSLRRTVLHVVERTIGQIVRDSIILRRASSHVVRVRLHIIGNMRIKNVGKSQSCMFLNYGLFRNRP